MVYSRWNMAKYNASHNRGDGFALHIWDVPVRASQTPQARIAPCRVTRIGEVNPAPIEEEGLLWQ